MGGCLPGRAAQRRRQDRARPLAGQGFAHDRGLGAPENEITATTVWREVVVCLPRPPVTWNAFPFHPHPPGDVLANRPLVAADLAAGEDYLRQVVCLFPDVPVV